jgi:hypothetical protein
MSFWMLSQTLLTLRMILPQEPVGSFRGRSVYPGHVSEVKCNVDGRLSLYCITDGKLVLYSQEWSTASGPGGLGTPAADREGENLQHG